MNPEHAPAGRSIRRFQRRLLAVGAAAGLLIALPGVSAAGAGDACDTPPAGYNVITGTSGDDFLVGTSGNDVI